MRVGRSGIEICSAVPGSINNSILWDRKCPKKFCLKDYEVLKYFFPISAKEDNVGDSEKDVQSDWVSVWLLLVAKSFERLLSESVCQSERLSRCGKPVKPSGSVCQSQRPRKKSSHPTLLRKYCQVIKQIQPLYTQILPSYLTNTTTLLTQILFAIYGESMSFFGPTMTLGGQIKIQNHFYVTNIPLEIFF